ncbi:MAG: hypothetical protein JSW68_13950, partial [Burkholderiales bacterium]
MSFEAIRVAGYPVDEDLLDAAVVGPETAHFANEYVATPRALIWHDPSSDWRLLVLMLPLASRLSLMRNPIFGQLVRDWGHHVRFIGVDRERRLFDFRRLLDAAVLGRLVDALALWLSQPAREREAATLDVLFAALADGMLTVLERRRDDWTAHLAREHRLEPGASDTLFDRKTRYPDFLARLRGALRDELIDVDFYCRALRSIELREEAFERRLAEAIETVLHRGSVRRLKQLAVGLHLGAYNWLLIDRKHASQRAYVLSRLGCCAHFFAETLLGEHEPDPVGEAGAAPGPGREAPLAPAALGRADLRRAETHVPWLDRDAFAQWLARAIDSGQDRQVIAAVSRRFGISENTVRALWREPPAMLGTPPAWHLRQILLRLDATPQRPWPRSAAEWQSRVSRAVPSVAA